MTALREQVLDWFVRRQREDWSSEDEHALKDWLDADPAHRSAYDRFDRHWTALDRLPADAVARLRARNASTAATMARTARKAVSHPSSQSWFGVRWVAAGIAVACLAAVSIVGALVWRDQQPVFLQQLATGRGEQIDVRLPDGSQLRLDSATRLSVAFYRNRREVILADGQALFSVQADTDRPFQVTAGPSRVTVVGTRFTVRYLPGFAGESGPVVAVEEGKVRVGRSDAATSSGRSANGSRGADALLTAGQQLAFRSDGWPGTASPIPPEGIAPWRDRQLSFIDMPLSRVLAELERYADSGLVLRDPGVAALRLSGTFDTTDPASFRRLLPRALPVRLQPTADGLEIRPIK
jgi:transmembrane sensor